MKLLLLCLILAIVGCGGGKQTFPDRSITLDEMFMMSYGEAVRIGGSGDIVRFIRVRSDSRCPKGVECITEGNASVVLEHTFIGQNPTRFVLNTSNPPRDTIINGYKFALLDVVPYPTAGDSIPQERYRLSLILARP
jgi:hypothetical protein